MSNYLRSSFPWFHWRQCFHAWRHREDTEEKGGLAFAPDECQMQSWVRLGKRQVFNCSLWSSFATQPFCHLLEDIIVCVDGHYYGINSIVHIINQKSILTSFIWFLRWNSGRHISLSHAFYAAHFNRNYEWDCFNRYNLQFWLLPRLSFCLYIIWYTFYRAHCSWTHRTCSSVEAMTSPRSILGQGWQTCNLHFYFPTKGQYV